jgi:ABC-type lipoprotein release transport system permease subunit
MWSHHAAATACALLIVTLVMGYVPARRVLRIKPAKLLVRSKSRRDEPLAQFSEGFSM